MMKKLNENQMLEVSGGGRCIYHFMAAAAFGLFWIIADRQNLAECWNGTHPGG